VKCIGTFVNGRFLERPNRFLAKIQLEYSSTSDEIDLAHVPDPGRLKELLIPNAPIILRLSVNKKRKTKYSLVGVKTKNIWVNIDSQISNRLFQEEYKQIKHFLNYDILKTEYSYEKSRYDFLLINNKKRKKALVEIKSVTLVQEKRAFFPDAPTIRGTKHVTELVTAVKQGFEAFVVFIIKRNDATSFSPNRNMDPNFTKALNFAVQNGVSVYAVKCLYDPVLNKELRIIEEVPIFLDEVNQIQSD
jgi:sugar fermentation stimulation protein A